MRALGWLVLTALLGCGDEPGGGNGGGGDGGSGGSSAEKCYSVPINELTDGSSACGPVVCQGGQYCLSDAGICNPGCQSELECPPAQYCDLSNAGAEGIGLCRTPGPALEVACGAEPGSCSSRCAAKALQCGAPDDVAEQQCAALCPMVSEEQLSCLEAAACEELEQLTQGQRVCGIGPIE